jgi:ech hydrogenase subunit A
MGKLVAVTRNQEKVEKGFFEEPWAPLYIITGLVIATVLPSRSSLRR